MLRLGPMLLSLLLSASTTLANPVPIPVSNGIITARDQWDFSDWKGQGQVRTRYINSPYPDLGCITAAGKWTTDEALCGVFETSWINNYTFHLASAASPDKEYAVGACGIDVSTFKCGGGVGQGIFGTFGSGGPILGHPVLRYGQYGVMATNAQDSPPAVTDAPLAIHFYSGTEKGKWVWLTWQSLDGDDGSGSSE